MGNNLIKKIDLDNGLELKFYDASKKVAGDRWRVKLTAKIEIPVNDYAEGLSTGIDANDILQNLGEKTFFEKSLERNFIDDKEKENILYGFLNSFIESSVPYLSTSNFPKQFVAKKYKEAKKQSGWYRV